jgi:hypothetical protein
MYCIYTVIKILVLNIFLCRQPGICVVKSPPPPLVSVAQSILWGIYKRGRKCVGPKMLGDGGGGTVVSLGHLAPILLNNLSQDRPGRMYIHILNCTVHTFRDAYTYIMPCTLYRYHLPFLLKGLSHQIRNA